MDDMISSTGARTLAFISDNLLERVTTAGAVNTPIYMLSLLRTFPTTDPDKQISKQKITSCFYESILRFIQQNFLNMCPIFLSHGNI